jgi:hypothetical protein
MPATRYKPHLERSLLFGEAEVRGIGTKGPRTSCSGQEREADSNTEVRAPLLTFISHVDKLCEACKPYVCVRIVCTLQLVGVLSACQQCCRSLLRLVLCSMVLLLTFSASVASCSTAMSLSASYPTTLAGLSSPPVNVTYDKLTSLKDSLSQIAQHHCCVCTVAHGGTS